MTTTPVLSPAHNSLYLFSKNKINCLFCLLSCIICNFTSRTVVYRWYKKKQHLHSGSGFSCDYEVLWHMCIAIYITLTQVVWVFWPAFNVHFISWMNCKVFNLNCTDIIYFFQHDAEFINSMISPVVENHENLSTIKMPI